MRRLMRSMSVGFFGKATLALAVTTGGMTVTSTLKAEDPQEEKVVVVTVDGEETKVEVPKVWVGITLKELEGDLARYLGQEEGILVDSVFEDSPADKAGLKEGDILIEADDTKLAEPKSLLAVLSGLDKDESSEITLKVLRKGDEIKVQVTPADRPELKELDIEHLEKMHIDLSKLHGAEESVRKALERMRAAGVNKDLNIFRFGSPSMVFETEGEVDSDVEIVIVKEIDGEKVEVRVAREDDQPATVTMKEGDEEKVYTIDNLDEMPDEIVAIVKPILGDKGKIRIGSKIRLIGPDLEDLKLGNIDHEALVKKAREMAEKHRAHSEEIAAKARASADRIRARTREAIEVSTEMKEMRSLIKKLQKEVEELRAKLKEDD